ncbi:aldo/keto reductase [Salinigranum halophilum]|uniref:aldo/keto reductase n=1 Tax=Salinigranum halophilum TaxID=2565931 RepID=UPI0010A8A3B6|nr:aldo/keto reductase [Salinigranum halophilum]
MDCVFVGAGAVAEKYAAGLTDTSLRLTAVCDRDVDRARSIAADTGATPYTDLTAMLASEPASLVVNLTSHAAHAPVTDECLAAGRHVFSEKPLALDPDRADRLVESARERGLALGCAPINHRGDAQRHARSFLADGRLGEVRLAYATAHVGRVTSWHSRPESFLAVGPLYDGAVYPLSLLVSWFGPVERVRRADALDAWPGDRTGGDDARPPHVEATLAFAAGVQVSLRASFYVDHRSREFYGLELHGDDGTLYLRDAGAQAAETESVTVRGGGREPTAAPHPFPRREQPYLAGPERLARAVERGHRPEASARRSAHVVRVCAAIEAAAASGGSVPVDGPTCPTPTLTPPPVRPSAPSPRQGRSEGQNQRQSRKAIRLPPVGFGCSRYRDGDYVDRIDSVATALDAGYRLFDSAELYGNESRIGDLLAAPGSPDRESLFVLGKPWNTNHGPGYLREACEGSLAELGIDAFDCYALHWPDAWTYQGPLRELASLPVDEQERLTFPTDEDGEPARADHDLLDTWRRLERLQEAGLTRTLGLCNVTVPQVARVVDEATEPPALVQVERHPYRPREELVAWCHARGIRVLAHSPLSAPGLLANPVVESVADDVGTSPAAVVLAWNVQRGVVPIPSSVDPDHVVANLAAARLRLSETQLARLDDLADPSFER